jgi:hypothetical protein
MTTAPIPIHTMTHPLVILRVGDITPTWCSVHMVLTDHLYTGHSLECLECKPHTPCKVDVIDNIRTQHAER